MRGHFFMTKIDNLLNDTKSKNFITECGINGEINFKISQEFTNNIYGGRSGQYIAGEIIAFFSMDEAVGLNGKRNFEINIYNLYKYDLNERINKIKNKTKPNFNIEEISKENTLKGLFAKEILEEINNKNYDEEIIELALEIGMEILE
jgi:hypothetical protein